MLHILADLAHGPSRFVSEHERRMNNEAASAPVEEVVQIGSTDTDRTDTQLNI